MTTRAVQLADRKFRDRARTARTSEAEAVRHSDEGHRAAAEQLRYDLAAPTRAREAAAAALLARKAAPDAPRKASDIKKPS